MRYKVCNTANTPQFLQVTLLQHCIAKICNKLSFGPFSGTIGCRRMLYMLVKSTRTHAHTYTCIRTHTFIHVGYTYPYIYAHIHIYVHLLHSGNIILRQRLSALGNWGVVTNVYVCDELNNIYSPHPLSFSFSHIDKMTLFGIIV